jgi:hypothetical protein
MSLSPTLAKSGSQCLIATFKSSTILERGTPTWKGLDWPSRRQKTLRSASGMSKVKLALGLDTHRHPDIVLTPWTLPTSAPYHLDTRSQHPPNPLPTAIVLGRGKPLREYQCLTIRTRPEWYHPRWGQNTIRRRLPCENVGGRVSVLVRSLLSRVTCPTSSH